MCHAIKFRFIKQPTTSSRGRRRAEAGPEQGARQQLRAQPRTATQNGGQTQGIKAYHTLKYSLYCLMYYFKGVLQEPRVRALRGRPFKSSNQIHAKRMHNDRRYKKCHFVPII